MGLSSSSISVSEMSVPLYRNNVTSSCLLILPSLFRSRRLNVSLISGRNIGLLSVANPEGVWWGWGSAATAFPEFMLGLGWGKGPARSCNNESDWLIPGENTHPTIPGDRLKCTIPVSAICDRQGKFTHSKSIALLRVQVLTLVKFGGYGSSNERCVMMNCLNLLKIIGV